MFINNIKEKVSNKNEFAIDYKSIFLNMIDGFAYHEIITNDLGEAVDYRFIDVNHAFELMTGLKKSYIIGKLVTEVIPGIKEDSTGWIDKYGKVALGGVKIEFENYSSSFKKWFKVSAYSPQINYFVTIFEDITARKESERDIDLRNQEMERINRLMIDRELKMVELKNKVAELEEKLKNY